MPRLLCLCCLALLLAACGPSRTGQLVLVDELKQLRPEPLQQRAVPILTRGTDVVVILVRRGGAADVAGRLQQVGHWSEGHITPYSLALYVSLEPRYSELRVGSRWSDLLPPTRLEQLRSELLNPGLRSGGFQTALESSLSGVAQEMQRVTRRQRLVLATVLGALASGAGGWVLYGWRHRRGLAWLWGCTPMGRAEARRELAQALRDCEQWRVALERFAGLPLPAELQRSLSEWQAAVPAPAGLRQHCSRARELRDQLLELQAARGKCEQSYQHTHQILADIRRARLPREQRKKRHQDGYLGPEELAVVIRWEEQLAELRQQKALSLTQLGQLHLQQKAIYDAASELWKQHSPESWRARFTAPASAAGGGWEHSSSQVTTPGASESSSGDSGSYDGGSSSPESSAGGEW